VKDASARIALDDAHVYRLDGEPIPGNTEMLKGAGLVNTEWFTPESAARGTRVHDAAQYLAEGDLDWSTVLPEDRGYVDGVATFLARSGFVCEANEFLIWSDALRYGTKPDFLGVLNGRRVLIQLKTGDVRPVVGVQLALEKIAANERIAAQDLPFTHRLEWVNGSPYVDGRFALRVFNDGRWKLHPEFIDPLDERAAVGIVTTHHWRLRHGYKAAA
jgi:hypothetical protein